ncbi:MAG TPA: CvpA family protein [Prolixibacteraceae bacterium]|jgi:membrane protein required for colicin V production|nr:CvpA family protein [Bacteroidales bacterium]HPJ78214.1 CvpA family protein [Prolixibacteraceae bacterium]HRV90334.1 CvpA family protein [Prolixibacteraceae bacterium]
MNYLDIVLAILLLLSAINGFVKGFVEELAGLAGLILGIWAALRFSDRVAQFLFDQFHWTFDHLDIIAFVITFILVIILVSLIGSWVNKMVKAVALGFLNRLAGLAFGVIKGALILSIFLVIFHKFDQDVHIINQNVKASSRLFNPLKNFAPGVFPFLDFWGENSSDNDEG